MADQEYQRRLTAILSADVAGYSLLMRDDEAATVRTITTYRKALAQLIQQYRGRMVDSPGDNILAEFTSVVDAVNCAVEIQRELAERNAEMPEDRKMKFRIGINLGDVIAEGKRIYGDGVNIAARLEGLADVGGICISGTVYDAIESKIGLEYEFLGEQEVKNIDKPIRAYRVLSYPGAAAHRVVKAKKAEGKKWRKLTTAAVAVITVAAVAAIVWNSYLRPPVIEKASIEKMAFTLPDKPSIAVLPFNNMSGDPKQEYFSDGITEEIITALSKTPKMLVIARNTTFTYKGKAVKINQIAEELGVQYVLEGSIRKSNNRVRITVQLIDAITGHHLWAERYDRNLEDVFSLQDEITIKIISALQVKLTDGEIAHISATRTQNLEAYLKILKARDYYMHFNKRDNTLAQRSAEESIALDPGYPFPYALLGWTHFLDVWYGTSKSPKQSISRAFDLAQKGLALDPSLVQAHSLLAYLYTFKKQYEKGIAEAERTVEINPNFADGYCHIARILHYVGRNMESIELYKKAMRLNPYPPSFYYYQMGYCYFMTDQYEEAIVKFNNAIKLQPDNLPAFIGLAAVYGISGRNEESMKVVKEIRRLDPKFSGERWVDKSPYKNEADKQRLKNGLLKARL